MHFHSTIAFLVASKSTWLVVVYLAITYGPPAIADHVDPPRPPAEELKLVEQAHKLWNDRDYKTALEVQERLLALRQRQYAVDKKGHPHIVVSLIDIGELHRRLGNTKNAEKHFTDALSMSRNLSDKPNEDKYLCHAKLADIYANQRRLEDAERHLIAARDLSQTLHPDGHPNTVDKLVDLAIVQMAQGKSRAARKSIDAATKVARSVYPAGDREIIKCLFHSADIALQFGDYPRATKECQLALKSLSESAAEKIDKGESLFLEIRIRRQLGASYQFQQMHKEAKAHFSILLDLTKRAFPKEAFPSGHSEIVSSIRLVASAHRELGELDIARQLLETAYEMALTLYKRDPGRRNTEQLVRSGRVFALVAADQNRFSQSQKLLIDAIKRWNKIVQFKSDREFLALLRLDLGNVYRSMGDPLTAELQLVEARTLMQSLSDSDSSTHASILSRLGLVYEDLSDHQKAAQHHEAAYQMRKRLYLQNDYPHGHPDLAESLHNLAANLEMLGEYQRSDELYRKALAIWRHFYPKGHSDLARTLGSYGLTLQALSKYEEAESCYREAIQFVESHSEADSLSVISARSNLGYLHFTRKQYDDALKQFEQVLRTDGISWQVRASNLQNVACVKMAQRDFESASSALEKALSTVHDGQSSVSDGVADPLEAWIVLTMAKLEDARKEPGRAIDLYQQAAAMENRWVSHLLRLSASEGMNLVARYLRTPHGLLNATRNLPDTDADVYDVLWNRRSLIMDTILLKQQLTRISQSPKTHDQIKKYRDVRRRLARLYIARRNMGSDQLRNSQDTWKSINKEKEEIEKQLIGGAMMSSMPSALKNVQFQQLVENLPPTTNFVDVFAYLARESESKPVLHYAAFILRHSRKPTRVEFGPASVIDAAILQWRNDLADGVVGDQPQLLRTRLWKPLERHISESGTLVIRPEGLMGAMPWCALPIADGNEVLIDKYSVAQAPSGRLLASTLRSPKSASLAEDFLIVADVDYGSSENRTADGDQGENDPVWEKIDGGDLQASKLDSLLRNHTTMKISALNGTQASSDQVAEALQRSNMAYIETHAFCEQRDGEQDRPDWSEFAKHPMVAPPQERADIVERNPLLVAALVMASANESAPSNSSTQSDSSFLSAEEIAGLDLSEVDLAVLAACDTGIGEQVMGEGMFALHRAFHLAGAKTLVSSLWRVDAGSTQELMRSFLRILSQNPDIGRAEAFRQAQLQLKAKPFDSDNPFHWAGWSISGDIGPIRIPIVAFPSKGVEPPAENYQGVEASSWGFGWIEILSCLSILGVLAFVIWWLRLRRRLATSTTRL